MLWAVGPAKETEIHRPLDVWAIRSVLDKQPRMLTLALDTACYVAYDMANCKLAKAWKGGISIDGAPYTGQKEIQPTSWGTIYLTDSLQHFAWAAWQNGQAQPVRVQSKGYIFRKNQIYLQYDLIVASRDTIRIEERPEFVRDETGKPGLERTFVTQHVSPNVSVSLKAASGDVLLKPNGTTRHATYFEPLPPQFLPVAQKQYAHKGQELIEKSDCFTCHEADEANVGPAFRQIAARYQKDKNTLARLTAKVRNGGTGRVG